MSKVLYIKANVKPEGMSRTFKISDSFIEAYKESHPQDEIITLDLNKEDIGFLKTEDLDSLFGEKTEESKNHPILKYAYQFAEADKYVIAEPLWNLSIPAVLKAYIDYVSVVGITFKYSETGVIGLCTDKKVVNITARGADYTTGAYAPYEMGDKYLRGILGLFGITDFTTISADGLDLVENDAEKIVENAINIAKEKAKSF